MLWVLISLLGIFLVLWGLSWVLRTDAGIVAARIKQLIRWALVLLGSGIVGSRIGFFRISALLLPFLLKNFNRAQRDQHYQEQEDHPRSKRGQSKVSVQEARRILNVSENASDEQITQAWRKLMRKAHPDQGGSQEDAVQLNRARDILLKKK